MSAAEIGESLPSAELGELVDRLSPEIQAILARHCVNERLAEEIIFETMMALGLRWHTVKDRDRWFLDTLERACAQTGAATPPDVN